MANIPADKLQIGRTLLAGGPITQETLQRELQQSGKGESVLGKALLQSGFPNEADLIVPILQRLRIPKINARNTKIPLETIRLVPEQVAKSSRVLPIDLIGRILVVVTPDLQNTDALAEVRKQTGYLVTPIQCSADGFDGIVQDYYSRMAAAGLTSAAPVGAASAAAAGAPVAARNGNVQAIPAGPETEDFFWKRYMSGGPVAAEENQM